jgi:hypothetical protein
VFKILYCSAKLITVLGLASLLGACAGTPAVVNPPDNAAPGIVVDGIKCEPASAVTFNNSFSFKHLTT